MASNNELFYKLGHLTGLSNSDLHSDNARGAQTARPGTIAWVVDAYGPRIVKYVKSMIGSTNVMGELMAYESDGGNVRSTSITANAAGTTTAINTGTVLVANDHVDQLVFVVDDAGGAGAAPEGQTSVCASNTTGTVNLAADYAFSAATATNDTFELISTYHANDAADGDEAWTCHGVVLGKDGIQDNQFGWVHMQGTTNCTVTGATTNTITEGDPIVAAAAGVGDFGSDGQELWVGIANAGFNAVDAGNSTMIAEIRLFSYAGTGASP